MLLLETSAFGKQVWPSTISPTPCRNTGIGTSISFTFSCSLKKKTCNFEIYTFVKKIELTLFYTTFFEAYTKQNLSKFVPISFCKTCYFLLFTKCIAIFVTSTLPLPKHKYADSIILLGRGPRQGDDFLKIMRNRQKYTKKCLILHKYVINLIFC